MPGLASKSLARRIAAAAGIATAVGAGVNLLAYGLLLRSYPERAAPIAAALTILLALLVAAIVLRQIVETVGRPLTHLVDAMSKAEEGDFLARVPVSRDDELGALSTAFNRMLAAITNLRVSVIDADRELKLAAERLRLQEALEGKGIELERQFNERRLLFDVLSTSTSSLSLNDVLASIARAAGHSLGLREFAILLREDDTDDIVVRAAYGFANPEQVLGLRRKAGESVSGEVARTGQAAVIDDVQKDDRYLSYGGLVERRGSFVCVPSRYRGKVIALLDFTRAGVAAFSPTDVALLCALGEVAAHAIGNARLFERVEALSMTDELTGLGNRRYLEGHLEMEFARAQRFSQSLSVLFIDLDHFKLLNDRCGHPAGDMVLRSVADVIRRSVRRLDTVTRYGGEEIVVLLPRTEKAEAIAVGNKIRERVATELRRSPEAAQQPGGALTISIGVATCPADAADAADLVSRADQALYEAKSSGRNRVVGWRSAPAAKAAARPV